jgi:hypothetical protein
MEGSEAYRGKKFGKNLCKLVVDGVSLQSVLTEGLLEATLCETKEKSSNNFFAFKSFFAFLVLPNKNMLIVKLHCLPCEVFLIFCKIIKTESIIILFTTEDPSNAL